MQIERCLRCGGEMKDLGKMTFQMGEYRMVTGHRSNLLAGSMTMEVYRCADCGKLEFFARGGCPYCGGYIEEDDNVCPNCRRRLPKNTNNEEEKENRR